MTQKQKEEEQQQEEEEQKKKNGASKAKGEHRVLFQKVFVFVEKSVRSTERAEEVVMRLGFVCLQTGIRQQEGIMCRR